MNSQKKRDRYFLIGSIAVLLCSLLPLLYIGKYNVLAADDYSMCKEMYHVVQNGGTIRDIFQYAIEYVSKTYHTWIGCFSVSLLDIFNPGVFNKHYTFLTPIVMITALLLSLYIFIRCMITYFYGQKHRTEIVILWAALSFLIIQTMPSPVEGLYWYAGAVAYTLLHFLLFLFVGLQIWAGGIQKKSRKILYVIAGSILALVIGGSQYTTALLAVIIMAFIIVLLNKRLKLHQWIPCIFLVTGFGVSIFSPGNRMRQAGAVGMAPVKAILYSFADALQYGRRWISPLLIFSMLFVLPFIWKLIKNNQGKYQYRYPLLVFLFSFCIFAAGFTPSLYGVGNVDAGRIQNQIQSLFYVLFFADLFYALGWLNRKIRESQKEIYRDAGTVIGILEKYETVLQIFFACIILLIFVGTGDKNTFSSISALRSLVTGEAQTYYEEAQERIRIYEDDSLPVAEVEPFTVRPHVLYFTDIVEEGDPNYWINENIAEYYEKEKVVLK